MTQVSGSSAYKQLQTPKDGISQAMQFWGSQSNQRQAAAKLANERAQVRKDKAVKDWEAKFGLKESDFANKYTGFKSFDDMNTDFSMYATNEYVNLQRKAKDALMKGNLDEKTRLEGEMIRLKNAFGEASKSQQYFGKMFTSYRKSVHEGKVSGASKDFEDIVQEAILNKNVALRMVDGNLVYTGMKEGKDGVRIPFTVPYQDLMDGSFSWYKKQQVSGEGGIVDNVLNDLGKITKESTNGYYKITEQKWDDKVQGDAADKAVDTLLGNDEIMGDLLYQFSVREKGGQISKMHNFEDKEYDLVKSKLMKMIKGGYDQKYGKDFLGSKYSSDSRPKKGSENQASDATLVKDASGMASQQLLEKYPNAKNGRIKAYTVRTKGGASPKGLLSDRPKSEMLAIILAEDGSIHANYRDVRDITDTEKEVEGIDSKLNTIIEGGTNTTSRIKRQETFVDTRELKDEEIARVAKFYGVGDRDGLIKYLNNIGGNVDFGTGNKPSTESSTKSWGDFN